ncbi:hypothetical protein [Sorangium sp. So ce362]|uniref:hypothetical protein n=1 Tax=Sorangium sp. So ce362 TaxID=3133303 RepID=UPI003F620515
MRGVPVDELMPHTARFVMPAVGDTVLSESPADALRAGRFHRVPVLSGATQDEGRLFGIRGVDVEVAHQLDFWSTL